MDTQKPYTVAIIGRPNVGKSTLFNKLCKKKKAIVARVAGVTRDYQIEKINWENYHLNIVDTSGFEKKDNDILRPFIYKQYHQALDVADAFLFLCDGQLPISSLDHELLEEIRKWDKPCIRAVNKIDTTYFREHESEFFEFFNSPFERISAEKGIGIDHLLGIFERKFKLVPEGRKVAPYTAKVVIMGRPNVGKSTLMNLLLKKERMIVSPIPGTTRDAIDSMIEVDGKNYLLIDTAGLRKKRKIEERVEAISTYKAIESLERSEIVLLVIDATQGITEQDVRIVGLAWDRGVSVNILLNKWDLLEPEKRDNSYWQKHIWSKLRMFNKIPFLFISALEKKNVHKIFELVELTKKTHEKVVDAKELKENFESWVRRTPPPRYKLTRNRRIPLRFYNCVQIDHAPPRFRIKVNHPSGVSLAYEQFLKNQIRETFAFWEVPLFLEYKPIH